MKINRLWEYKDDFCTVYVKFASQDLKSLRFDLVTKSLTRHDPFSNLCETLSRKNSDQDS